MEVQQPDSWRMWQYLVFQINLKLEEIEEEAKLEEEF